MKQLFHPVLVVFLTIITAVFILAISARGQNVVLQGRQFTQVVDSTSLGQDTKTEYTYKDSKGRVYDVYLSKRGKAYIKRVSRNGREYKQYLPEVTKQLNQQK